MFNRILVAIDERGHAEHAVPVAAELAARFQGQLFLVTVIADSGLVAELSEMAAGEGLYVGEVTQRLLDEMEEIAIRHSAHDFVRLDLEGEPVEKILEAAQSTGADLIVMGLHICDHVGHGRDVPHEISARAPCACMIVR